MTSPDNPQALLLASESEFQDEMRVWGTGGWQPPAQREARDWLTLMRLCGWSIQVAGAEGTLPLSASSAGLRWIVLGCPPEGVSESRADGLARLLAAAPVSVVMRSAPAASALSKLAGVSRAAGIRETTRARWHCPGAPTEWTFNGSIPIHDVVVAEDVETWARAADGAGIVMARRAGRGMVVTLAFHPGEARDASGMATDMLRRVLLRAAQAPVAWIDWSGTMLLRMDDPGGSQNVFCGPWCYPELGAQEWHEIGAELRRRDACLSVAYSAGWVDDGDPERGELLVDGRPAERVPGRVHPSSRVRYRDVRGHRPGAVSDYAGQYGVLRELRESGEVGVELHGYTHMHPAHAAWASAADRYEAVEWYRELGPNASAAIAAAGRDRHPLCLGIRALAEQFELHPTSLICPGDKWTNAVLERALELDIQLVSSHYLALRHADRFCWSTYVCAPYLDRPEDRWFDAGVPVVGYFHDRDLALYGVSWLRCWLDAWQKAGARRFLDFAELAGVLSQTVSLEGTRASLRIHPPGTRTRPRRKPLPVNVRFPDGNLPRSLEVADGGERQTVRVEPLDREEGRVILPCAPAVVAVEGGKALAGPGR